jgi:DNA modification methylase
MNITCTTADTLDIADLTEFQSDIKRRSFNDIEKILLSFDRLGFSFPFYVWRNEKKNYILDGHGRLAALKYLREQKGEVIPPLPVVYVDAEDEKQAKEKLLQCNARYGIFSLPKVKDWLGSFDFDPTKIKIPDLSLTTITKEIAEPLIDPPAPAVYSKSGVCYHLLDATLICGDATDIETYWELLKKRRIDMALTSPPYNSKINKFPLKFGIQESLYNDDVMDDKTEAEQIAMCMKVLENLAAFVNEKHTIVWNVSYTAHDRNSYGKVLFSPNNPFQVMDTIAWDKDTNVFLGNNHLFRRAELIFALAKTYAQYKINLGLDNSITNLWEFAAQGAQQKTHKACFPLSMANQAVKLFSHAGDVVVDPFCGAGTTLIAAQRLNRVSFGIEISAKYCDLIRRRFTSWATELGFTPDQIGDGYLEE